MTRKSYLIIILAVLNSFLIFAQDFSHEFGKIGKREIEFKQYSLDKNAEAIVFFDIGKSYFIKVDGTFEVIFERTTRLKVLTESGVKWAKVEIPFYHEGGINEEILNIEAYSYNYENGHIIKTPLNTKNVYDERINNYWSIRKFMVPNVKVGSIIEYKYRVCSKYMFNLRDWEFQKKIPVKYSEYIVKMIPFYEYNWLLQGAKKIDFQDSYLDRRPARQFGPVNFKDMVNKFVMKDVPAFKTEKFISSINDYIIKIDFQLSKINYPSGGTKKMFDTWENLVNKFIKNKDFGKYLKKSQKITSKLFKKEKKNLKTEKEKFDLAINYLKNNFNWNNENSKYASKSPKRFIKEKIGNCTDINLFAIGLLRTLGIKAYPVLVSTRDHGKIKYDYPYVHFFNYVLILANVDGRKILSDATEIFNKNNRIPSRCINDKGLVVDKKNIEWISLECEFPSVEKTKIKLEIDKDNIHAYISITATEYDSYFYRKNYSNDIETIKHNIETENYFVSDTSINIQNLSDYDKPYILNYIQDSKVEMINKKIYLSPFANVAISSNPLKQKNRKYPIDMTYPKLRYFYASIKIPKGYKVEYLPDKKKISNSLFDLSYSATSDNNKIFISFNYYFKKSVYSSSDYQRIKYYFDEIVEKANDKIVFSIKL